jgi:hypothetical protein
LAPTFPPEIVRRMEFGCDPRPALDQARGKYQGPPRIPKTALPGADRHTNRGRETSLQRPEPLMVDHLKRPDRRESTRGPQPLPHRCGHRPPNECWTELLGSSTTHNYPRTWRAHVGQPSSQTRHPQSGVPRVVHTGAAIRKACWSVPLQRGAAVKRGKLGEETAFPFGDKTLQARLWIACSE